MQLCEAQDLCHGLFPPHLSPSLPQTSAPPDPHPAPPLFHFLCSGMSRPTLVICAFDSQCRPTFPASSTCPPTSAALAQLVRLWTFVPGVPTARSSLPSNCLWIFPSHSGLEGTSIITHTLCFPFQLYVYLQLLSLACWMSVGVWLGLDLAVTMSVE